MPTARKDKEGWFRCSGCGHKLGKMVGAWPEIRAMPAIEIKCHSCGTLNYIMVGGKKESNEDSRSNRR